MSNPPNSWEEAAGDDEQLARQTNEQLNIQQQQQRGAFRPNFNAASFNPGASTFQPGAPAFTPGNQYPQYGGQQGYYGGNTGGYDYSQYGGYPQYGQNQYQQYQQYQPQYQQQPQQHQQHQQQYRPQQHYQQQFQGQQQQPVIAKRPQGQGGGAPQNQNQQNQQRLPPTGPAAPKAATTPPAPTQPSSNTAPKVLKIGGSSAVPAPAKKEDNPIGAAVLTIGGAAPKPAAVLTIGGAAPKPAAVLNIGASKETKAENNKPATAEKAEPAKAEGPTKAPATKAAAGTAAGGGKAPGATAAEKAAERREADAVLKEVEEAVDDATIDEIFGKEHVNLIFIGHVDAGKSSLGGSILYATGMVDERTMDKYKQEAKAAGRETWYLSWALDLTKEERAKGKTVEVGRAYFETEKRRYTILDAPGHKTFVPSMIGGASQADVGILVISARKGEYETGFEKGGQTREHAVLAKTQGVNKLIVAVNKMDDPTVEWSKERYDECLLKLTQFLKATGYNPKTDICFMPLSALTGLNLKERVSKDICPWYNGPSLLEYLDSMKALDRKVKSPFMMPIAGKYKDMGTVVEGKIESGFVKKGSNILMMPGKTPVEVLAIYSETEEEVLAATCGDQVRLRVKGVEEEDVMPGYVMTSVKSPVNCVSKFEAQIHILDLKNILTAGFQCVLHVHTTIQEVTFTALLHKLEKGTGRKSKKPPQFAAKGQAIIAQLESTSSFPIERYEDYQQLGRFTLRDQGQTIAIGKVTKLIMDNAPSA